nr:MAG TPA: hypothetical protein [Caudoviricetes sp.]DAN46073.1 MAG TPA: hypothetical protein [Caudoviricetes sp.]
MSEKAQSQKCDMVIINKLQQNSQRKIAMEQKCSMLKINKL